MVVVPLKKQRGKFLNQWEDPDQMNLDEVKRCFFFIVTDSELLSKVQQY